NIYVAGSFGQTATFGTISLTSAGQVGNGDAFLAKLDPAGNFIWARQFGGAGDDYAFGVAVDGGGNVYASGRFSGTASFGAGLSLTAVGYYSDGYVVKVDSSGNTLWARGMGGGGTISNGQDTAIALATDPNGNVYVTGIFVGTGTFGSTSLTSKGVQDTFVTKLDASGNFQWAQRMGGEGDYD